MVVSALLLAEVAPAVIVTVQNSQGMGVRHEYVIATGITADSQTYDKSYVRGKSDAAVDSWGKVWLQFNLTDVWATYGKENLASASLTIRAENGTGRRFSVAGPSDGIDESWTMAGLTMTALSIYSISIMRLLKTGCFARTH